MMMSGCGEHSHSCLCTRNGILALTWKMSSVCLWPYCHILGKGVCVQKCREGSDSLSWLL